MGGPSNGNEIGVFRVGGVGSDIKKTSWTQAGAAIAFAIDTGGKVKFFWNGSKIGEVSNWDATNAKISSLLMPYWADAGADSNLYYGKWEIRVGYWDSDATMATRTSNDKTYYGW
jgi:hypothetical protein